MIAGCQQAAPVQPAAAVPGQTKENPVRAGQDVSKARPAPQSDQPGKTRIVEALVDALDEIPDGNAEVRQSRDQLKKDLREADKELSKYLGDSAKRRIMEANKKPPIPVIMPRPKPVPKPKEGEDEADQKPNAEPPSAEAPAEQD
jgi:hypothetical protein